MILDDIFKEAIKQKASDVHLVHGQPVIFRIYRKLQKVKDWPAVDSEAIFGLVSQILTRKQKVELFEKKSLDFSYEIRKAGRFRINIFWEKGNLALAARIIWSEVPTMEEVGMTPVIYELLKLNQGLIIITGPAGCGKSTSLAAMVNYINNHRDCHIITFEDPIEYIFLSQKSLVVQRELGKDFLSFPDALKQVVRQDPNVMMVGEMRDLETIGAAITLAETGHLILATLHTANASQTIDRIVDIFPPYQQTQIRLQLSLTLRGIISQQLLPKIGGGLVAAREILINTPAIANLIRTNNIPQIRSAIQTGASEGMSTMDQNLKNLYRKGIISKENALAHALYPEDIIKSGDLVFRND